MNLRPPRQIVFGCAALALSLPACSEGASQSPNLAASGGIARGGSDNFNSTTANSTSAHANGGGGNANPNGGSTSAIGGSAKGTASGATSPSTELGSTPQGGMGHLATGGSVTVVGGQSNRSAGAVSGGVTSNGGFSSSVDNSASGGVASAGGSTARVGVTSSAIPNQSGNPLNGIVNTYTSWLSTASGDAAKLTADKALANNMITWQMPHGGWFKYGKAKYASPWNGSDPRADWTGANGVELGTIDNNGTVTEIMFLADVYQRSQEIKYRDAAREGFDFVLGMQTTTGGLPQVYPTRPNSYSNYVTFNDNAMVRALGMLDLAVQHKAPFSGDPFSAAQLERARDALSKGVDYILKAQIVQAGVKTVWCAQHDPNTYAPMGARSYELPSKSGSESVGVIGFLLSQPQTEQVKAAVEAAIAWYKSPAVKVDNTAYVSRPSSNTDDSYNPIQTKAGSTMWYRFYDLDKDTGFFSGRLPSDDPPGVGKKYDIMQIEAERRYGYQWGGSYGTALFAYTDKIGY